MTPAVMAAKKAKVKVDIRRYDHDANADSFGMEAAEKLGLDPRRVFKTLISDIDFGDRHGLAVALVPVTAMLDLKKLAAVLDAKRADMADAAQAERATGYQVGGISPLGQKRRLPTVADDTIGEFETVFVSAGRRGLQIEIAPGDLLRLIDGKKAPIAVS